MTTQPGLAQDAL